MYAFSDVNRGVPVSKLSCFDEVVNFIGFYGSLASLLMWIFSIILFITLIIACSLCCFKNDNDDISPNRY